MEYKVVKDIPDHIKLQDKVTLDLWPEFMLHDPVSLANWTRLFELFPEYQFSLIANDEVIGVANTLPFYWDKPFTDLPETGWDWVFKRGINDKLTGKNVNVLNGLQIAVNKEHQGQGISYIILEEMMALAKAKGFKYITIPVRPSLKSKYQLIPIDNYIDWKGEDNLPFDPWLRVHVKSGGQIIKPCHEAMYIPGTVAEWEDWTNMKFLETGDFIIKGALTPVKINLENNIGEYIEPNVWVLHKVD